MNTSTKIVHIITELALGGAQKSTLNLIKNLQESKEQHILISSIPKNKKRSFLAEFMQINKLQIKLLPTLTRKINPIYDVITLLHLVLYIKKEKPAIVHTHSSKAGILGPLAAYLCNTKKIIHTFHGFAFHDFQNKTVKAAYILLHKFGSFFCTNLIFISESDFQKAKKHNIGNDKKNIMIRDCIDLDSFFNKHAKAETNQKTKFILGTISCLKKQKGLIYLLKALQILKEKKYSFELRICGGGKQKKILQRTAKKLKLTDDVKFLGWQKDIPQIISEFNIFILSSLWEGLPIALTESMAAGIPAIAPAINGIPEVIKDKKNGLLFNACDHKMLAGKIELLMTDKDLYTDIRKEAKRFIKENKEFNLQTTILQIKAIYYE